MKYTRSILSLGAAVGSLLFTLSHRVAAGESPSTIRIDSENDIALFYSDGSRPSVGLQSINDQLSEIGVRVSRVPIPDAARTVLLASKKRRLSHREYNALIKHFHLGRRELLNEIHRAGRRPEMRRGGYLQSSEVDVAPYPKVYDMNALDDSLETYLQRKFGRLHVNSSDAGVGIDEVMTIVSGGPYTWFFVLKNNVVGKLRLGAVGEDGKAWRLSYPGLVPHGGYFDAPDGLVVAHAHGPKHFVMRYNDPSVEGLATLGDNPWIDFATDKPRLLDRPKAMPDHEKGAR